MQDNQVQAPRSARQDSDRHFEVPQVQEVRPESHPRPDDAEATGSSPPPTPETEAPGSNAEA